MQEAKVDNGAKAPTIPNRRISPSQYTTDKAFQSQNGLRLAPATYNSPNQSSQNELRLAPATYNSPNQSSQEMEDSTMSFSTRHPGVTESKLRNIEERHNDDDSFSSSYPGAVAVLPGLDPSRAHLESLKAAQNESNYISNRLVCGGGGHVTSGNTISASVIPVAATVVENDEADTERKEELARLRHLVDNAVQAEHVTISHHEHRQTEDMKPPSKKLSPLVLVPQSKEELQEGQSMGQQTRFNESSQTKSKGKKKTFKALCCGSHAVILDTVVLTEAP